MPKIHSHEITLLGVDFPDYFRGGSARGYDNCFVGIGNSERAAVDDALEQCAISGWEWPNGEPSLDEYSTENAVLDAMEKGVADDVGSAPDLTYRVAIYPYSGCGPYILERGLEPDAAHARLCEHHAKHVDAAREDGLEVSDIAETCSDACSPDSWRYEVSRTNGVMVSDLEGHYVAEPEPESIKALEEYRRKLELYEEAMDAQFYVVLGVSREEHGKEAPL